MHGDCIRHCTPAARMSFLRLQSGDCQVRPAGFLHAVDQADLGVTLVELREAFLQIVGLVPLAGAEVGKQIDDSLLTGIFAEQLLDGIEGRQGLGGGLRNVDRIQGARPGRLGKVGIDRLLLEIRPGAAIAAAGRAKDAGA